MARSRAAGGWGFAMWELIAVTLVIVVLTYGFFASWAQRDSAESSPGKRRIVLLTEELGFIGATIFLAGSIAVIDQRGNDVRDWGHVIVYSLAAALLLLAGIRVRRIGNTAVHQHQVDALWFLSVAAFSAAVAYATHWLINTSGYMPRGAATVLAMGLAVPVYAAALWRVRRRALQNIALFAGLILTICGIIVTLANPASWLAYALVLWGFGVAWAWFGWRYVEPGRVSLAFGAALALIAPSFAAGQYGWLYAIAIPTAAAAMAASAPLQDKPLLVLGTLAALGYASWAVVRYLHQPLGIPAMIAVAGALIVGLAAVTARLLHAAK
jgi:hypothetical protein